MFVDAWVLNVQQAQRCTLVAMARNDRGGKVAVQRIIALLAFLRAAVLALSDWLSTEALVFEIVLIEPSPLAAER